MTTRAQAPSIQRSNARQQLRESELPDPQLRRKLNKALVDIQRDALNPLALQGLVIDYNLANWTSSGYNYPDIRTSFTPRGVVVVFWEQENSPNATFTAQPALQIKPKPGGAQVVAAFGLPTTAKSYHLRILVLK